MPGYWRADGTYSNGSNDVQLIGSNVTLLSAVTATGAGTPKPVGSMKSYVFEAGGTATAFVFHIEVVGPLGVPRTINKVWDELNNVYLSGSDITVAGFYSVSVPAFASIQANVVSITGGNVNVQGGLMQ